MVEEILFCGDSQNGGSQSQSQARYQEIGPPDWRAHQLMMPGHYMISCFDRSIYNIYVGEERRSILFQIPCIDIPGRRRGGHLPLMRGLMISRRHSDTPLLKYNKYTKNNIQQYNNITAYHIRHNITVPQGNICEHLSIKVSLLCNIKATIYPLYCPHFIAN